MAQERYVYIAQQRLEADPGVEFGLTELWHILIRDRYWLLAFVVLFLIGGGLYAYLSTPLYRAEVRMLPANADNSGAALGALGQLGGIASLAGITLQSSGESEPLEVLRSKDFLRLFIEERKLIGVLFAGESRVPEKRRGKDVPDIRDAVDYFDDEIRSIEETSSTGVITLVVTWKDPTQAADWANDMIARLNARLRERELAESEKNIHFLQEQLRTEDKLSIQQVISGLLERELQKALVARGREEFAFRVVDQARVPKRPYVPRRNLALVVSGFLGLVFGTLFVLAKAAHRPTPVQTRR